CEVDAGRRDKRVEVVLLAAGPQQRVLLVAGAADDLVAVVDCLGDGALRGVRAGEVGHHAALPQERVCGDVVGRGGPAGDISGVVDVVRGAEVTAQGAQVAQVLPVPQERVEGLITGKVVLPDDFAAVVQPAGAAPGAAECSEVAHVAVLPQERVGGRDAAVRRVRGGVRVRVTGDLAAGIERGHQG